MDDGLSARQALSLLVEAVREAGEIGLRFARDGAKTFTKSDASPVTEADLAIDAHLMQRLRPVSPAVGWLSEEAADSEERLARPQTWIVDPIDGTRGFVAGNGECVISAALAAGGRPLAGVLLRPTTGDLYEAALGHGAFKNGTRLVATDGAAAATRRAAGPKLFIDTLQAGAPAATRHPSLASLALRIALVAEGEIDAAFAKPNSHDWDIAAADLILHEAGGRLTHLDGSPVIYNRPDPAHGSLLAAGPRRHDELVALFREHASLPQS